MKTFLFTLVLSISWLSPLQAQQDVVETSQGDLSVHPIYHGSLVLQWQDKTIFIDPYGGAALYKNVPAPDYIIITDIHGDHYNPETFLSLPYRQAVFIVPEAVAVLLQKENVEEKNIIVIKNGEKKDFENLSIEAVPMYNLPESPDSRHPKGRGNGYILSSGNTRVYISGDTEDIPEMRQLKNIDVAFICMNLPYTMSINQAADAVLDFQPAIVYPFHYRGEGGKLSDIEAFKRLVNDQNKKIEVRLKDWYGGK